MDSEIYYRIYKCKDDVLRVVCMQDFDEYDYIQEDFLKDENGEKLIFDNEDSANKALNSFIKNTELKVGQYVRTAGDVYEPSKIGKIKEIDIVSFKEVCYRIDSCGKHILIPESFIVKSSFNIIELIKEDDMVNKVLITKVDLKSQRLEYEEDFGTYYIDKESIEEVLTHEQYEANCYKIGE